MIDAISQNDLERLAAYYLLANTPSFIWNRFRSDPAVMSLSDCYSQDDLVSQFKALSLDSHATEDIVAAYALLTAICLKVYDPREFSGQLENLSRLDWGSAIVRLAGSRAMASTEVNIDNAWQDRIISPAPTLALGSTNSHTVPQNSCVLKNPGHPVLTNSSSDTELTIDRGNSND